MADDEIETLRPAHVCRTLLAALEASEGRRKSRKRDQTPDAIGLTIKRDILMRAVKDDPEPEAFEHWLLQCAQLCAPEFAGAVSAMARAVFDEWRMAHALRNFRDWLDAGAPSEDAHEGTRKERAPQPAEIK
jgi:hypothetical protein